MRALVPASARIPKNSAKKKSPRIDIRGLSCLISIRLIVHTVAGVATTSGRSFATALDPRGRPIVPAGVVDLLSGNPDPALLPDLGSAFAELPREPVLYGAAGSDPELLALANILLRIAEEIPNEDRRATREARDEIAYVLRLISEKEGVMQPSPSGCLH